MYDGRCCPTFVRLQGYTQLMKLNINRIETESESSNKSGVIESLCLDFCLRKALAVTSTPVPKLKVHELP